MSVRFCNSIFWLPKTDPTAAAKGFGFMDEVITLAMWLVAHLLIVVYIVHHETNEYVFPRADAEEARGVGEAHRPFSHGTCASCGR